MNKIYLFGKIISKSKLKYVIVPNLRIFIEILIETISGDIFTCVMDETILDEVRNIKLQDYVYITGMCKIETGMAFVIVKEIYK